MRGKRDEREGRRRRSTPTGALLARRAIALLIAAALIIGLALRDGGYDIVVRGELGVVLWAALALALAAGALPRARLGRPATAALALLAAFAAANALALAWTDSAERTLDEVARAIQIGGAAALALLALNRFTWQGAAAGISVALLVIPAFSIAARLAPGAFTDEAAAFFDTDRLSYPFGYWNGVAACGAMAIAVGLAWSAHARTAWVRAACLASLPVAALAVYLSYSRTGAAAVALAVLAAIAIGRNRWTAALNAVGAGAGAVVAISVARGEPAIAHGAGSEGAAAVLAALLAGCLLAGATALVTYGAGSDRLRVSRSVSRAAVGVAAVAVLVGSLTVGRGPIADGWAEFRDQRTIAAGPDPASRLASLGGTRYDVWSSALAAFRKEPVRGVGPGGFELWWSREGRNPEFVRDAHSLYLEQLAELGAPGLLLLLAALVCLVVAAVEARRRLARSHEIGATTALIAAFAVFAAYAAVDWVWELGALSVAAIGGLAVAAAAGSERSGARRLGAGTVMIAVAGALLLIAAQVPGVVSTDRLRASADELETGSRARAGELADDAVRAAPWAAGPLAQRALVAEADGRYTDARADLLDAIEREETDWRHRLLLARVEARAGAAAAARANLAEARRLAPRLAPLAPGSPYLEQIEEALGETGDRVSPQGGRRG